MEVGDVFREYKLIKLLDAGAYGEVWLAQSIGVSEFCALKLITDPTKAGIELDSLKLYVDLCANKELVAKHCLVPIDHHGHGLAPESIYYTMPLADDLNGPARHVRIPEHYRHKTLEAWRLNTSIKAAEFLAVARAILTALQFLHDKQLVHCDVKPKNIIAIYGGWRLGDFGVMIHRERINSKTDRGTPGFKERQLPMTYKSDVFSLGVTLMQLATKSPGDPTTDLLRFREDDLPLQLADADGLEPEIKKLITNACAIKPSSRPHVDEMLRAVTKLESGLTPSDVEQKPREREQKRWQLKNPASLRFCLTNPKRDATVAYAGKLLTSVGQVRAIAMSVGSLTVAYDDLDTQSLLFSNTTLLREIDHHDVVLLGSGGSAESNSRTRELLDNLNRTLASKVVRDNCGRRLVRIDTPAVERPRWPAATGAEIQEQVQSCRIHFEIEGVAIKEYDDRIDPLTGELLVDHCLAMRISNKFSPAHRLFLFAGIHNPGTEAAARWFINQFDPNELPDRQWAVAAVIRCELAGGEIESVTEAVKTIFKFPGWS